MEINKQLFEDVLSGKLKGKFVFKNVHNIYGVALKPNHTCIQKALTDGFYIIRMPSLLFNVVNTDGKSVYGCTNHKGYSENDSNYDIIDFIPDTNMKENELTIEIPNGKIVDWEESKRQNKIVLKDKEQLLAYEEICDKLDGMIDIPLFDTPSEDGNALVANEHQLECLLAKNKLANVAMFLNNGWQPEEGKENGWFIFYNERIHGLVFEEASEYCYDCNVFFKSKELAQQAVEILGKEIVMRAVEPLGFVKSK